MKNIFVFTNFANSMDGKISTTKKVDLKPSPTDRKLMDIHRYRADVVVNGAGTVRAFQKPMLIQSKSLIQKRRAEGKTSHPINVVVSFKLDLNPNWKYFTSNETLKLLFVPNTVSRKKLKPFENKCGIGFFDPKKNIAIQMAKLLESMGLRKILLEGGGGLMPPWVEADLVDEWNLTISPKVIGGKDAPTMVEGSGLEASQIRFYHLKSVKKVKDELFLQYTR